MRTLPSPLLSAISRVTTVRANEIDHDVACICDAHVASLDETEVFVLCHEHGVSAGRVFCSLECLAVELGEQADLVCDAPMVASIVAAIEADFAACRKASGVVTCECCGEHYHRSAPHLARQFARLDALETVIDAELRRARHTAPTLRPEAA